MHQRNDSGSIALEASLALPFFSLLLLGAVSLLQVAAADLALRSAVSETVKTSAADMYPVKLLYVEAKSRVEASMAGQVWNSVSGHVQQARANVTTAEQFTEDYAEYIPEPVVRLIEGEKQMRTALEGEAGGQLNAAKSAIARQIAKEAINPVLVSFADTGLLKRDKLQVTSVDWPILDDDRHAWIGIEAQYEMKLPLPFVTATIVLKKRATERCWIGIQGGS
jgi:hypothetical protein